MKEYKFNEFNGDEFLEHIGVPSTYLKLRRLFMEQQGDFEKWPEMFKEFEEENGKVPKRDEVSTSVSGKYMKIMLGKSELARADDRLTYIVKVNKFDMTKSKDRLLCTGFMYYTGRKKSCLDSLVVIDVNENNLNFREVNKIYELNEMEFNDIVNKYLNSIGIFL